MPDFSDMLRQTIAGIEARHGVGPDKSRPAILPAAAVMELRAAAARYAEQLAGPRFKVGDLVTPLANATVKGAGDPHIILEVRTGVEPLWLDSRELIASSVNGMRLDVRIAHLHRDDGDICLHWVESYELELWVEPIEMGGA